MHPFLSKISQRARAPQDEGGTSCREKSGHEEGGERGDDLVAKLISAFAVQRVSAAHGFRRVPRAVSVDPLAVGHELTHHPIPIRVTDGPGDSCRRRQYAAGSRSWCRSPWSPRLLHVLRWRRPTAPLAGGASDRDPARWPSPASPPLDPAVESFVTDLMSRMSLEQKVGQVIQAELGSVTPADVRRYHLGSVLNGGGSTPNDNKRASAATGLRRRRLLRSLDAAACWPAGDTDHLGIGCRARSPQRLWRNDLSAQHRPRRGERSGPAARDRRGTALEMRVTGLEWTFAPTLAVVRDDRWGRTYEGYSEDPRIAALYAAAIVTACKALRAVSVISPGTRSSRRPSTISATAEPSADATRATTSMTRPTLCACTRPGIRRPSKQVSVP